MTQMRLTKGQSSPGPRRQNEAKTGDDHQDKNKEDQEENKNGGGKRGGKTRRAKWQRREQRTFERTK